MRRKKQIEDMIKPEESLDESLEMDENNMQPNEINKKRRLEVKNKKVVKSIVITIIAVAIFTIILVGIAVLNKINTKVYGNIYLNGTNISGKTEEEVSEAIKKMSETLGKKSLKILQGTKVILEIDAKDIELNIDEKATLSKAMSFGRDGNILSNNFAIAKAMLMKARLEVVYTYSDTKLVALVGEITTNIDGKVIDDAFQINESEYKLVITKGKAGLDINIEEFKADIIDIFKNKEADSYKIKTTRREPNKLDIDVVYSQVAREAKNAYIDDTVKPTIYEKHIVGISFNKDKLREVMAKEENQKEGKVISFDLTKIEPEVKLSDIKTNLYEDKIASYTTSFANSDANRASNLRLGISMMNGTVIMPGEIFSFNAVMGDCGLSSRGFKSAAVFKGGKVVKEIGGGICQLSSTLYNTALYANLEIVARSNHALPVGYVPPSRDATIYYPYLDFKFKNNRNYPIKIVATYTTAKKMTIAIYGTFEEVEYEVVLTSWITSTIPPKAIYENDSTMEVGKQKVTQLGVNGYKSAANKKLRLNGKVVKTEMLSEDSYKAINKIISVGTKQVITTPVVTEPEKPKEPDIQEPIIPDPGSGGNENQDPNENPDSTENP